MTTSSKYGAAAAQSLTGKRTAPRQRTKCSMRPHPRTYQCSIPAGAAIQRNSPSSEEPSASINPSGSMSSIIPAASNSSSTSSATFNVPTTSGSKSSGPALPLGQIIGIVAAENIGLILICVIIMYIWRRRRRRRNGTVPEAVTAMKGGSLPFNTAASSSTTFPVPGSSLPDDESLPPGGTSIRPEGGWGQRRYD